MIERILQVDPVLAEDGVTVLFTGWTSNPDETFIASITLPQPIDEAEFERSVDEWRSLPWGALDWRRA